MLLLLDRAFELLLKAAILHKGGRIRENGENETFGHEKCVRVCLSDDRIKCLTNEQALTIQIVNSLRDAAQHYMLEVSEQQLYLYAQAGVTLYSDVLTSVFGGSLRDHIPDRVLPVCTMPPQDLHTMVRAEFAEIKIMVQPKSRRMLQARAKIRALAVIEASLNGVRSQPGEGELNGLLAKVRAGSTWKCDSSRTNFPAWIGRCKPSALVGHASNASGATLPMTYRPRNPENLTTPNIYAAWRSPITESTTRTSFRSPRISPHLNCCS
jgi:hypothetical protein